jgi:hypothetical protein
MPEYGISSGRHRQHRHQVGLATSSTARSGATCTPGFFTPSAPGGLRRNGEAAASQLDPVQGLLRRRLRPRGRRPHREGQALVLRGLRPAATPTTSDTGYLPEPGRCAPPPALPRSTPARTSADAEPHRLPAATPSASASRRSRRTDQRLQQRGDTPTTGVAKLTWLINENHNVCRPPSTPSRTRTTRPDLAPTSATLQTPTTRITR